VVFATLAGGAPLLAERLATRGGPDIDLRDPDAYYDTSSFGPRMVETMARWVGPRQLVYGSDRPVVDPVATGREAELLATAGALFSATPAPALALAR
jgi:predicted TIM-barrel fold metal-dependent hydrolase